MGIDNVVNKVLNHLLSSTGIDPETVDPENRLIEDLEMTNEQIDRFIGGVAGDFQLRKGFTVKERRDLSLRQIVDLIRAELANSVPKAS